MNRIFDFLSRLMIYAATFLLLASCSSDDGPDNPEDNNPTGAGSDFVGVWEESIGDFVFFKEGYSKLDANNFGKWTYNKDTNILATTNDGWQFMVTLSSKDQWAAIGISSKEKTYTFNRVTGLDAIYAVIKGASYKDENGEQITMPSHLANYKIGRNGYKYANAIGELCGGYVEFIEDDDNNDLTYKYQAYTLESFLPYKGDRIYYFQADMNDRGTAVFSDIYSVEKCKLVMTSSHEKKEDRIIRTFVFDNKGN